MAEASALVFSEYSAGHETGSHPENQARLTAINQRLRREHFLEQRTVLQSEPIEAEAVARVHAERLVDITRSLSEQGGGFIDGDTYVSSGSYEAALASAGAAVRAVDLVMSGEHDRAFSMSRPPGHHAERRRQMGFCLFNNIAIAATHAIEQHGVERIAIIDWDVHHGNGTQDIFYESSQVLFCSVHQWPLFPGTGLENERGAGAGEGYTLNVPLPPGMGDQDYLSTFDDILAPAVSRFAPDLLMISAGFDAHADDPLAMMSLSDRGFGRLASRVRTWADRFSDGRLVLILEGGYNLRALSDSVVAVLRSIDTPDSTERDRL